MNKKATSIVAYIFLIGWVIAFFAGDREGAKFHLNQGLVLVLISSFAGYITWIPFVGFVLDIIISVAILVFAIIGIVYAAQDQDKELPLIGKIKIMN